MFKKFLIFYLIVGAFFWLLHHEELTAQFKHMNMLDSSEEKLDFDSKEGKLAVFIAIILTWPLLICMIGR